MQLRYLTNVSSLALDVDRCTGCGACLDVCPHGVFVIEDRKSQIVDLDACMECGACAANCALDALSVNAGVGCAAAVLIGFFSGGEPTCG